MIPKLEEVQAAFQRIADGAKARLYGKKVDEDTRERDRDTVNRWANAEGVDLEGEAQRARQKFEDVDRANN